jgi:predicted esterase
MQILLGYLTKDGDEILPNKTVRRDAFTFTVVGYDAGAVVAAALARLRPREVERLVLVSPLGVPGAFKCEDVMFKACRCVRTEKRVVQSARRYYADKRACDVFRQRQEEEIALQVQLTPGYLKCVYSMRANFPVHDALETYQAIGKDDRQVLIVWGDRDVICNVHKYELLMKLMPHASFYVCHGSGHNVMFEAHRKFVRKMVRFLRGEYETALARARKAATEVKEARRKLEEERKREEEERRRELEAATSLDRRAASTRLSKKKKQREEEAAAAKRREEEDKFKVIEADINRARAMYNMATHEILDLPEDEGPSSESEYEEVPEAEIARLERRIQDEEAEAERKRRIERLQEKRRNFGLKIDESRKLDVIDKEEEKRRAEEEELKRRETERDEAALQTEDIIGAVEGDDERDEDADIERKQQQRYEKAIEAAEAAAGYDSHELESNESELDEATRIKLVREELERRRELAAKRAESKTAVEVDQQVAAATAKPAEATGKRRRARRAGSSRMSSVSSLPSSTGEP